MRENSTYSQEDSDKLKKVLIRHIEEVWGHRCNTKDYEDFPELHDDLIAVGDANIGRCPVCLVYEKFDAFWKASHDEG